MKKLIIILALLLPFFGFSQIQDEYYRVADWTFYPDSVIQLTDTTYSVYATPANYNDPGAIERIVGNYVVDFVGHRYIIVDSTSTYLTLYDIYHTGQAPQTGQIAHCYRSVGNGEAQFIGSVDYSTLDESARWKINGADNELMWQRVENKVPYLGAKKDVDLGANSISTDTVKIDGVPLLLNTFKQGNLGGASNIFYSTGASSQPASGTVNQVIGGNSLSANYVPRWDGSKFVNSGIYELSGRFGIGATNPVSKLVISDGANFGIEIDPVSLNNIGRIYAFNRGTTQFKDIRFGSTTNPIVFTSIGRLGVNKTSPMEQLDVNGNLIADILKSRVATGTPPLVVASTTKVDSLNVGLLDGKKASDFQLKSDTLTFDATLSDLQDSASAIRALANTKAVVSGTDNYIMKKTGANTLGNSSITDNGSMVSTSLPFSSTISLSASTHFAGSSYWNSNFLELGYGQTGNRYAAIDLTGDDTYSDYGLRLIRDNTGADAVSQILHRGKGVFSFVTQEAAPIIFTTKGVTGLTIDTLQNVGVGDSHPIAKLHVVESTILDSIQGAYQIITSEQGNAGGNRFRNNKWILRDLNGKDWYSTRWHDAIDIDGVFSTPQNNTLTWWERDPFHNIQSWGTNNTTYFILNAENAGFGTSTPAARIHSQSTSTQARLGYDANKYTDLSTGSTGNLTIDPTGDTTKFVGAVNSTGGFFKNGVEITGGSSSMVYPLNSGIVTYNGTTWGTSITNNSNLWNNAYDKKIVSAAFSGTSTKTLTLYQQDGNVLQASFTDESGGAGNWSTDTYGLYYDAGQVGIGTNSVSNTHLTVGTVSSDKNAIYAISQTNTGVRGISRDYVGVFGSSTDGYGVYGVSAYYYGGGFDHGVNIASGNLDIQGQTRISQSGFFQPVSSSDAAAPNNSIYYSTTQSKLVYKNASGTVNVLY